MEKLDLVIALLVTFFSGIFIGSGVCRITPMTEKQYMLRLITRGIRRL